MDHDGITKPEVFEESDERMDRRTEQGDRTEGHASFAAFLGGRIRDRRRELTGRWVAKLQAQLDIDAEDVLPSEDLLNHIPDVLERIADFVADPGAKPLEALVLQDIGRLAEVRRRQGFGLPELLREYHILSGIIQETAEEAAAECPGSPRPPEVAASVGRLMDAVNLISATTAHTLNLWRDRYDRERDDLLDIFEEIISHELGNRLGAAETAVQLLNSASSTDEERRSRLCEVILESIREGRQTAKDVATLARPFSPETAAHISLWLVVKESVRLAEHEADGRGISIAVQGDVPEVKVPGPPVRIALANLLANAIRHHRDAGADRWVRLSTRRVRDSGTIEVAVEDNGPGIPEPAREKVFEYRFRGDLPTEGSGLGLAITREVITQAGGVISLRDGSEGGSLFVLRVPAFEKTD